LFKKEKKVFSWNVFEKKKEKGTRFKGAMKGNDVGVKVQRLMDVNLKKKKREIHKKIKRERVTIYL
jgi:hypothetical protein